MAIDKAKIHAALAAVHETERCVLNPDGLTRVVATEQVIRESTLTHTEIDILLSALHVSRTELTVQFGKAE